MHAKKSSDHPLIDQRMALWIGLALVACLALKFFWPLWFYDMPLGYDPGLYRYLFLKHAEGFPPFWIAELEPWARGHPLGLFFFSTILLRIGIPVDWLIGWMWNLFAVMLPVVFSWVMRKRYGTLVGLGTLLAALLSIAYFDGFAAMYWKTFASLFWCVLTYSALEKRSWWAAPLGILAVITHHQTGLLFGLVFVSWIILPFITFVQSTQASDRRFSRRDAVVALGVGFVIFLVGLLAYLPVWKETITQHLPALLGQQEAASGSFPAASFYLRTQGILLLLGAYGLLQNLRHERWTLWQLSVLWSLAFVVLRLLFYRRFFLQLDFFLLPFAGIAVADLWTRFQDYAHRGVLITLLILQLLIMQQSVQWRRPMIDDATLEAVAEAHDAIPENGSILGLDNESVVVLRGWMADRHVGGPGLFESTWDYAQWEKFLIGTHEEREALLATLPRPLFIFESPLFRSYYGDYATAFLHDSCFVETSHPMLYEVTCPSAVPSLP